MYCAGCDGFSGIWEDGRQPAVAMLDFRVCWSVLENVEKRRAPHRLVLPGKKTALQRMNGYSGQFIDSGPGDRQSDLGPASYRRVLHVELCRAPADVASRTRARELPDSSHHMSCARRRRRYRRTRIPRFRSSVPVVRTVDLRLLIWI